MAKGILLTASVLVFLAVMLGAFAAHALSAQLDSTMKAIFETANHYHFYHALGLLFIGLFMGQYPHTQVMHWAAYSMLIGVFIFSGSLYALSITGVRWLGMVTPIGGVLLLIAWVITAYAIWTTDVNLPVQ